MAEYDLAAVVPVRRGSTRLKNKNGLPFGDQDSLIAWKLEQLKKVLPAERIYLSTESDDYKPIGKAAGVRIHDRDPRLSDDSTAFSEVVHGIASEIEHEHIAWCHVTSPLMSPREYVQSFERYQTHVISGPHDSLIGVNLRKEYLWNDEGPMNYEANANHVYSQHLPNIYRLTNSLYMRDRASMMSGCYYIGARPYKMELSMMAGVDIDYEEEYEIAVALYPLYLKHHD